MDIYIDGGGSASKIYKNINNKIIYFSKSKKMNIASFREETIKNLNHIVKTITSELDEEINFYIGIPGLIETDKNSIEKELKLKYKKIKNISLMLDIEIQLLINIGQDYKSENFLYIVSGTGSNSIVCIDGTLYRKGGWGHLIGDEGSSYDFSKNWICRALKDYEKGENSKFISAVIDFFKLKDIDNIIDIYKKQLEIKQIFSKFSDYILVKKHSNYTQEINFIMDIISKNLAFYLIEVVNVQKLKKIYFFGKLFLNNVYETNIKRIISAGSNAEIINLNK